MKREVFIQSAIKLSGDKIIYFDPFKIDKPFHDADYIFITHDHYDHFEISSIKNVMSEKTTLIVPSVLENEASKITKNILAVVPDREYKLPGLEFKPIKAYNISKPFHPEGAGYVGYLLKINKESYYIMGDTDVTKDAKMVVSDVCFIPIGGKYTMDYLEAATYINEMKPKVVVPIHYGSIVGDISLGQKFKELIDNHIEVEIYIKEE